MKPTELMIGDWVLLFDKYPAKVEAIGDNDAFLLDTDGVRWNVGYAFIKPIALTPETLEKNGFEDVGSEVYECDVLPFYIWWECDRHRLGIDIEDSTYDKENFGQMLRVPVSCVHELQHALRLCGIEKEIVL